MHSRAAAGFDVAWWTVDFYCGWPRSPHQGLWCSGCLGVSGCARRNMPACIFLSYSWFNFLTLKIHLPVCLCMCPNVCVCELWRSIMTDSHLHKTAPMSTRLVCCPHSPVSYPSFFSSTCRGVSRWQALRRCECLCVCVCVFTFNSSHTHPVRCHSHGLDRSWAESERTAVCERRLVCT